MAEKTLNTRIQQKHDIEANWLKAVNFIPKVGEVIVYDIDETHTTPRMKIGDGVKNINELEFIGEKAAAETHAHEHAVGVEGLVITWDGDEAGRDVIAISESSQIVKISDAVPTVDDLSEGAILSRPQPSMVENEIITISSEEAISAIQDDGYCNGSIGFFIIPEDNYANDGIVFPTKGIYSWRDIIDETVIYIQSLSIPGYIRVGGSDPLTPDMIGAVPVGRTINGKTLDTDITLTAEDLGVATPNWNATKREPGYIENRTHFLYPREAVEVYSEFTATFTDDRYTFTSAPNVFPLVEDDVCTVIWNGVAYDNIRPDIFNVAGTPIKGCSLSTSAFSIELYQELYEFGRTGDIHSSYGYIYAKDGSSSATIIITCKIAIPKKLDERYLPDAEHSPIMRGFRTPSAAWGGILAYPGSNGEYSFAYGAGVDASGRGSVAFGSNTSAGHHAMAVGYNTAASEGAFASGVNTKARGYTSHTEGENTEASGLWSHAEGSGSKALGRATHAEGEYTIARGEYQHVQGSCNIEDHNNNYIHIVGNGFYGGTEDSIVRSNAHTLDWSGNGWFAGGLKVGGTGQDDTAAVSVLTENDMTAITNAEIDILFQ